MTWNLLFILEVILGFGLLIFVHELGHFLAAKCVGIRVEKFSLGFGKRLFGFTRGDTEYVVAAIPLGGYVKMAGEVYLEDRPGEPGEFFSKSPGQRAFVILAGPAMNLISAFPAAMLVYLLGINQVSTLCNVQENSPAYRAGMRSGVRVLSVDGDPVLSFSEMRTRIFLAAPGSVLKISAIQDEEREDFEIQTRMEAKTIGLDAFAGTNIFRVQPGSPAEKAGIRRGDRIEAVDGVKVRKWSEMSAEVDRCAGKTVKLTVARPEPSQEVSPKYVPVEIEAPLERRSRYDLGMDYDYVLLPAVGEPKKGMPAFGAGLKTDDVILSINDQKIETWKDMQRLVQDAVGKELALKVERGSNEELLDFQITPISHDGVGVIGISAGPMAIRVKSVIRADGPAAKAGLKAGDLITEVGGKAFKPRREGRVARWKRTLLKETVAESSPWLNEGLFETFIQQNQVEEIAITVRRTVDDRVRPQRTMLMLSPEFVENGYLGVVQGAETVLVRDGIVAAAVRAYHSTGAMIHDTGLSFYRLFTGGLSLKLIGGPVGISTALFYKAQEGFAHFVHLLFIISVNLALINLMPIPILDGGHLVLLVTEKLKGRPVQEKTMAAWQYCGLAFLLALVIFATKNDIMNFF